MEILRNPFSYPLTSLVEIKVGGGGVVVVGAAPIWKTNMLIELIVSNMLNEIMFSLSRG